VPTWSRVEEVLTPSRLPFAWEKRRSSAKFVTMNRRPPAFARTVRKRAAECKAREPKCAVPSADHELGAGLWTVFHCYADFWACAVYGMR
jgi:hypothetical protein